MLNEVQHDESALGLCISRESIPIARNRFPAKAGTQSFRLCRWAPAFAGEPVFQYCREGL
jgi:hypothetical protein